MVETTLVLLKPDCLAAKHCGDVLKRFEQAGLEIVGCKMVLLNDALLAEHYAHIADKPFYPALREFMHSSPVIVLALSGDYGKDSMLNMVHASDSPENAAVEMKRFFTDLEIFESTLKR
jgi:nucleoside-diphosphate kinase